MADPNLNRVAVIGSRRYIRPAIYWSIPLYDLDTETAQWL